MPPIVAFVGSLLFSAFLLWKGRKEFPDVSAVAWLPTLWMMRCASRSLTLWLYPRETDPATLAAFSDGSPHDQIFFVVLIVLGVVVLVNRVEHWDGLIRSNAFLIIFFVYMLMSVSWSPEPATSLKRWFRTFGDLLMVLVVLSEPNRMQTVSAVFWRCAGVLVPLSIVLGKYYPNYGRRQSKSWSVPDSWIGVTTDKNLLGTLALLAALFYLWRIFCRGGVRAAWRSDKLDVLLFSISTWLLLLGGGGRSSFSATAMLLLVVGAALLFWMRRTGAPPRVVFMTVFIVIMAIGMSNALTGDIMSSAALNWIPALVGRDSTLTDRTALWAALIPMGGQRPLLGAGFDTFWMTGPARALSRLTEFTWGPRQAHNGYLEIYLNLGLVGLLFFALACWRRFRTALEAAAGDRGVAQFILVLFMVTLLHNLTEASFGRPTQLMWFVFLLTAVTIPSTARRIAPQVTANRPGPTRGHPHVPLR